MARIIDRQATRAAISAKEMVNEYHEHWEWYDEDLDTFYKEEDDNHYLEDLDPRDEFSMMVNGDFDYDDAFDDDIPPIDYHHELYLELAY